MKPESSAQYAMHNAQYSMRSMQYTKWPLYCALSIACCLLFIACAQIVTPDGGPKDVTAPRAIRYSPDSAATNFHGTKIVITFDEYIALNDLNKQLIISPSVKRRPEVTIRKKDLIIEFRDSLAPNTTYSISFGTAIRDITETNVLQNFRYVFSTGPFIDSLKLSGHVVNAQTLRGEKNVLVMLYKNAPDSAPYKQKPYYYTRTDDNGNFLMTNLAAASYTIFALSDEGEDYLYNSTDERIAFSDSLITLQADVDSVRLLMFREKPVKQRLNRSVQLSPGRFRFEYNLPVANPSVTFSPPLPPAMEPFIEFSEMGDTVNIWFAKVQTDSVQFVFHSGSETLDSLSMKLNSPDKKPVKKGGTDFRAFKLQHNGIGGKLLPGTRFTIASTNPIRSVDSTRILFKRGADTLDPKIKRVSPRVIAFDVPFPEDSSFSVFIPPGAMIDWYGQKNDTLQTTFTVQPTRQFGNLSVQLPTLEPGKYLLEVVDDKDRVIRDTLITGKATCHFSVMPAGNYRIRLIHDDNGDGKWTPGNYPVRKQPERVFYYSTSVRVRAGWDMDIVWNLEDSVQ